MIVACTKMDGEQVYIHLDNGATVIVNVTDCAAYLMYMPDNSHYPKPFHGQDAFPSGPFDKAPN